MSEQTYSVLGSQLTGIADAIREKTGSNSQLSFPNGFTNAIDGMETYDFKTTTLHIPSANTSVAAYSFATICELYYWQGNNTPIRNIHLPNSVYLEASQRGAGTGEYYLNVVYYNSSNSSITIPKESITVTIDHVADFL